MAKYATQPICLPCWRETQGARGFHQLKGWPEEHCYRCGRRTNHGIYIRAEVRSDGR